MGLEEGLPVGEAVGDPGGPAVGLALGEVVGLEVVGEAVGAGVVHSACESHGSEAAPPQGMRPAPAQLGGSKTPTSTQRHGCVGGAVVGEAVGDAEQISVWRHSLPGQSQMSPD